MNGNLELVPGQSVLFSGKTYRITHLLDLHSVLAEDVATGEKKRLSIEGIRPMEAPSKGEDEETVAPELSLISDEDWLVAQERFNIIRPLLQNKGRTLDDVKKRAKLAKVHPATIYRWIEAYEDLGRVSALLTNRSSGGRGKGRLPKEVEKILEGTIKGKYLSKKRYSITKTFKEVAGLCRNANLQAPSLNTVRNRILLLSEKEKMSCRHGADKAEETFGPVLGSFPEADWPLAVIQIDHTKLDIILVDDLDRRPVGRPWITLAIDVFSRMVAGLYVSFDPPSALSVGLCLSHAILGKEKWLAKHQITTPWPVWGLPGTVHADNAKEFRGNMLKRACQDYQIDLVWRPVARPHFGGHIERLLGTFNEDIHALPGTTFSNIQQREGYDSEGSAAMTLSEFEKWLAIFITEVYHQKAHSAIKTSPIQMFERGIFGDGESPGRGLPARVMDEDRLRLDLMPYTKRSVQKYGIVIDEVHYYHDVLRRWINAKEPGDQKKRKFLIRRDPRDISVIFFHDPEVNQYYEIPYRDSSRPAISIWEFREARRRLKEEGTKDINEDLIFDAYERMRALEEQAVKETKKTRRMRQRKRTHLEASQNRPSTEPQAPDSELNLDNLSEDIAPFDEMEEW
ncbi:integrase core domain protein [Syntrophotalea carbinolica DSM 2380]|uniref:Integrase core domain protein n=1 Tax=Syntrophotalea carbinolica (strain DSM 2380 / NBRC 103641 / GraBd1) TaxID=338963 RepID=Q3A8A5_SYNC1|nr:Mu transposase C-terminal domain-containing protein [Syntrophotalea carbinolica]ABA87387.1 integrase core domain protein [Syntrophotalea carbinolica DSM 2380]